MTAGQATAQRIGHRHNVATARPDNVVVTRWVTRILVAADEVGQVPRYGSPEWQRLDNRDPRYLGALVIAAEAWRQHCSPDRIRSELELELDATSEAEERCFAEEFAAMAAKVRRAANRCTWEELQRRRYGVPDA